MTVSASLADCLVTPTAGVTTAGATVAAATGAAGCDCAGWLCCGGGATDCGKYFLSNGWNASITTNVSTKTSINRFSLPGSCCGFCMSGKVTVSSRVPHFSRLLREVGLFVTQALLHHRIVPPMRKGVTPQQPPQSHQPSAQRAIPFHRLHRVFRAGRNIAARRRKHRRDRPLITPQQLQRSEFGKLAHEKFRPQ